MTYSCVAVIILFGYSNVFYLPFDRRLELFNEYTVLMCVYNCFLFTEFVPSPGTRFSIGYSMIVCTLLNFAVNTFLLILATLKKMIKLFVIKK